MANPELPSMRLSLNGEPFEATPENTSLFSYTGRLAVYSHVFLVHNETEDGQGVEASYVWNSNPVYRELVAFMIEHEYPLHLNLTHIGESDVNNFEAEFFGDIGELDAGVPTSWE